MEQFNERLSALIDALGIKRTAFADKINVSQAFVSQMCSGVKQPSDRTISDICRVFNVDQRWLRDGENVPMFKELNRTAEISEFLGDILKSDIDFRGRLIAALAKLSPEQWRLLEKVANDLMKEMQKEAPDQ